MEMITQGVADEVEVSGPGACRVRIVGGGPRCHTQDPTRVLAMTTGAFPANDRDFETMQGSVGAWIDLAARLPVWPFREACGYAAVFEYDRVLGGSFGAVLDELANTYRDVAITTVGVDPSPGYYRAEYGLLPAFRIPRDDVRAGYGAALRCEPGGDPTGALGDTLNVLAIAGTAGAWSIFAQRDWEVGLLLTADREGSWLTAGLPWFDAEVDLDSIRSPAGWGAMLSEADRAEFARRLRERGSGPRPG